MQSCTVLCFHMHQQLMPCRLSTDEWADKVRRYGTLQELSIKPNPKKSSDPKVATQAEGERVLEANITTGALLALQVQTTYAFRFASCMHSQPTVVLLKVLRCL